MSTTAVERKPLIMACGCIEKGTSTWQGVTVRSSVCSHAGHATPMDPQPDLTGRVAVCGGHKGGPGKEKPSSFALAFFKYQPDKPTDEFYCGCWGWD